MLNKVAFLSCIAAAAALPAAENSGEMSVPLRPRGHYQPLDSGEVDTIGLFTMLNRTIGKYRKDAYIADLSSLFASEVEQRATGKVPLTDQSQQGQDVLYFGTTTIGKTTPQKFTIDFDTGSSDLFVPGPNCSSGCGKKKQYDEGGIDRHKTTSVTYGSGMISGEDFYDTVCAGGLCAKRQNLISLTNAQGFSSAASDGLMGMGFKAIANSKSNPFFLSLIKQKKVTAPEFSFYLGRAKSGTAKMSEMFLGGRNKAKYTGPVSEIPVSTPGYWQIPLDGVSVAGTQAPGSPGQAAIDTGTTIILGPTSAVTAVFALIPGSAPFPLGSGSAQITLFTYPCATTDIPSITFGGKEFKINPLDFSLGSLTNLFKVAAAGGGAGADGIIPGLPIGGGSGGSGGSLPLPGLDQCVASLGAFDIDPTQNLYVVGDSFLKNWYSIYNYKGKGGKPSVSFAAAKGNQK